MSNVFDKDGLAVTALTRVALDPKAIATMSKTIIPGFTPVIPRTNVPAYLKDIDGLRHKRVAYTSMISGQHSYGIFVGYTKEWNIGGKYNAQKWHPVVYDRSIAGYAVAIIDSIDYAPFETSMYSLLCAYMTEKQHIAIKSGTLNDRSYTQYAVQKDRSVSLVVTIFDYSFSSASASTRSYVVHTKEHKDLLRLNTAAIGLSVIYPEVKQHQRLVWDPADMSYSSQREGYIGNGIDLTPRILFNDFMRFFQPEDVDDAGKLLDYYLDHVMLRQAGKEANINLLDNGFTIFPGENLRKRIRLPERPYQVEFEALKFKLLNLIAAFGINVITTGDSNIVLYNNEMLSELLRVLAANGVNSAGSHYDKKHSTGFHKTLICKLLLPSVFIEHKGRLVLPAGSYINHAAIVDTIGGGSTALDTNHKQKGTQSELAAFHGALDEAIKTPGLSPTDIANVLGLVLF